jgi:hypothetical protein
MMRKKLDMNLMEILEGEAIYYHAEDCPSFCDFACNGSEGDVIAQAYNAGVTAATLPPAAEEGQGNEQGNAE